MRILEHRDRDFSKNLDMRSGGLAIGIPLTVIQYGVHTHTGATIDPATIANNFAVCEAIYTADRLTEDSEEWRVTCTRLAAIASTLFYASSPQTTLLAPLVPPLHLWYARLKPYIAPSKPFVVAALWTVSIYLVPIWRSVDGDIHPDWVQCAALFLSIASLSHAADVLDVDDDRDAGLRTPAVLMNGESGQYAIALALSSALLDTVSSHPVVIYDCISLAVTVGIVFEQFLLTGLVCLAFVAVYTVTHDYELFRAILISTESSHRIAIDSCTRIVEYAFTLDEPWRSFIINPTLAIANWGDNVGHTILSLYERAIRREL